MGRLFASPAPYMLLAPDEIAPGGGGPAAVPAPAAGPDQAAASASPAASRAAVEAPPGWLAPRLRAAKEQARKEALAEVGIVDPTKFKAEREEREKKLAEYERSAEEQKRSSMTELDRLKADLGAKDLRIAELEAQIRTAQVEAQSTRFDVVVQKTGADFIHPDMQEFAADALRRYMKTLPKELLRKFGEAETKVFFAKLAREKPRLARETAAPSKAAAAPPPRRPLTNGASPKAASTPGQAQPPNGKKPASSMTKDEVKAAWGKFGARAPG